MQRLRVVHRSDVPEDPGPPERSARWRVRPAGGFSGQVRSGGAADPALQLEWAGKRPCWFTGLRWRCVMAKAEFEDIYSFEYELSLSDIQDMCTVLPGWKNRRTHCIAASLSLVSLAGIFTAVGVALGLPSVVKNSPGVPGWMYIMGAILWCFAFRFVLVSWRLAPKRLARRIWRKEPQLHGRHHDRVGPDGVSWTNPDGVQVSFPLTKIDYIRETRSTFYLFDSQGHILSCLPKRGIASPDLTPGLCAFLIRTVEERRSLAVPSSAAGEAGTFG